MSLYSKFLRASVLPYILKRDNQADGYRNWKFFDQSQYWSKQKLLDYQWQKLSELLKHSYESCPYYTKIFNERGLIPDDIKDFGDLLKLPILTKDNMYDYQSEIVSNKYPLDTLEKSFSGGTTGNIQAEIYREHVGVQTKLGLSWRHESWMGRYRCDKQAYIWPTMMDFSEGGSFQYRFKMRYLIREMMYHCASSKEKVIRDIHKDYTKFNPEYLKVFPSALHIFTKTCLEFNLPFRPLKGILSTGEQLLPYQRKYFKSVYDCTILDMYGSRESGNNACECAEENGLHIAMETSLVEFVKDNRAVDYGENGEIFITDLSNFAFPLIRYQINDSGTPLKETCRCGRNLSLMSAGVGRVQDELMDSKGRPIAGLTLAIHLTNGHHVRIGQIQIIQKSLTLFKIYITDKPKPDEKILNYIDKTMRTMLGDDIEIDLNVVKEIPTEKSGKLRVTKNEIGK